MRKLGHPELGPIECNSRTSYLPSCGETERKRNEILQLALVGTDLAILDEIDSGLDADALQDFAKAVNGLLTPKNSFLMFTHYQLLLEYIKPKYIHIMDRGRIVKTGDFSIVEMLEKEGYKALSSV
ncbi:hypothetical protein NE237_008466 [Protea cynaroides]|uniref:Uncharacterized protein n=1 Tax=Protea cynaroides TaxID=273540 RepID=A0A9Q0KWJ3_9MAGN|nr:hypothetical protein NE237_008466 [Protea cynaroides]